MSQNQKELSRAILELAKAYLSSHAKPLALYDFAVRFAAVLKDWEYTVKEIDKLNRESFIALVHSWQSLADSHDLVVIKAVL